MALSKKRLWKGRDRTEKRLRAQLRKQGKLEGYLEMRQEIKKAALVVEVPELEAEASTGEN